MEELLPYYERELSFLRHYSRDFAQRYPKIAARLAFSGEEGEDPHVERMIESFALLGARINKKLDDDYPEFTEALLEVLYPHYLRPFPSCSIARFGAPSIALSQLTAPHVIARGTELKSRPIGGVRCRFRTAYDVTIAPIRVADARYASIAVAPGSTPMPGNASGVISITFESAVPQLDLSMLKMPVLRTHLHGEQSFVAALADCLFMNALAAYVELDRSGTWRALREVPYRQAGFDETDALIDYPARSHPAYRLLTEYFAFPDKFGFVDFDLDAMTRAAGRASRLTLHVVVNDVRSDSHVARLLDMLAASHFQLFCTPVVNLFAQHGEPIRITHQAASYPVVGHAQRASAYEVYSIDSVHLVRQRGDRDEVTEFRSFYSLHHGEAAQVGHYWFARRNDAVADKSPGYETEISVVDVDFEPATAQTDTLSVDLTCTNRDLPASLATGLEGGDLFLDGDSHGDGYDYDAPIAMLRRPTPSVRFERGRASHWRLVSHLALNHTSLALDDVAAVKEMLALYDMRRTAVSTRHIDGIVGIAHKPAVQWLPGQPFATFVRGVEIVLCIDDEHFVGTSLASFAQVIDAFFGLYVHINSFVQLTVVSKRTGEEIMRCKPRSGESILA